VKPILSVFEPPVRMPIVTVSVSDMESVSMAHHTRTNIGIDGAVAVAFVVVLIALHRPGVIYMR
jgi:hypothetical protein